MYINAMYIYRVSSSSFPQYPCPPVLVHGCAQGDDRTGRLVLVLLIPSLLLLLSTSVYVCVRASLSLSLPPCICIAIPNLL